MTHFLGNKQVCFHNLFRAKFAIRTSVQKSTKLFPKVCDKNEFSAAISGKGSLLSSSFLYLAFLYVKTSGLVTTSNGNAGFNGIAKMF